MGSHILTHDVTSGYTARMAKDRVTVTMDEDVVQALEGMATAQRRSFSAMVNYACAQMVGITGRAADQSNDKDATCD